MNPNYNHPLIHIIFQGANYHLCESFVDPSEDQQTENLTIDEFEW